MAHASAAAWALAARPEYGPIEALPSSQTSVSTSFTGPEYTNYWGDYGAYGGEIEVFDATIGGPIQRLTNPSLGSQTAGRGIKYIEPSNDGRAVGIVTPIDILEHQLGLLRGEHEELSRYIQGSY